jgi:hypothetical protein
MGGAGAGESRRVGVSLGSGQVGQVSALRRAAVARREGGRWQLVEPVEMGCLGSLCEPGAVGLASARRGSSTR